jgi:hypothetical protein
MDPDDLLKDGADNTVPLDPNDPENLKKISVNEDPPDAPPDDVIDTRSDHQQKDTNIQPEEVYDEVEDAAAGLSDPTRTGPPTDFTVGRPDSEGFDADGTEEAAADTPGEAGF